MFFFKKLDRLSVCTALFLISYYGASANYKSSPKKRMDINKLEWTFNLYFFKKYVLKKFMLP